MAVKSSRKSDNSTVAITFNLVGEIQKEDANYTNVTIKTNILKILVI